MWRTVRASIPPGSPPPWSTRRASRPRRSYAGQPCQQGSRISPGGALLGALREALPGYDIEDCTIPLPRELSFVGAIYPENQRGPLDRELVVHASMLVPLYMLYERHVQRAGESPRYRYEPSSELDPVALAIEREMVERHGYQRMDPALARIPILGIAVGNTLYGRATIADALFGDR